MNNINIGDFVYRKSYNKDILFSVIGIIGDIYYLKGINIRIYADAKKDDLEIQRVSRDFLDLFDKKNTLECKRLRSLNLLRNNNKEYQCGKILHIDGDDRYARKTLRYYRENNLPCSVYSIEEKKQPRYIRELLYKEKPKILIITGHDSLAKNKNIKDINNYKNSKYFKESVIQARRVERNKNKLAIFAGACQSYYEEIINAGANFASSPGRIFIDFFDPLVVAHVLSITDKNVIVSMSSFVDKLREGYRCINGIPTFGTAKIVK